MLRLLSCAGVLCLLAAGVGFAVAAGPGGKATALQRHASVATTDSNTRPALRPESASPRPIPARMLGPDAPVPLPPALLHVRNGWLVSDGRTLVAVYAGSAGNKASVGRLVIIRQDLAAGRQSIRTVDVRSTGALAITAAPLGASVEKSAQDAPIRVRTATGRGLRLDLRAGAVVRR